MLLKEVTDQGRLQYDHPLGLCLVAAGRGDTIPLKETFDLPDPTWLQFRRRFDKLAPDLAHCKPHLGRSPCHPGYPGAGVPVTLSAAQLTTMDEFHLHVAHASGPRSDPLRPCHDGQSHVKSRGVGAIASDGHTIICIILLLSLFMIFYSIGGKYPTRVSRSGPQTWNIAKSLEHCVVS
jgi:hypothetical protein